MYAALARAVWDGADSGQASAEIVKLRRRYPRASRHELGERLIRRTALQCAAAGLAWTGPAAFFGAIPAGPDVAYQIVAMNRMILGLAEIYRGSASGTDRAAGIGAGASAGLAADLLRRLLVTLLRKSLPQRPYARAVAGGLVGGALAYGTASAVGRLARDVFAGGGVSRLVRRLR